VIGFTTKYIPGETLAGPKIPFRFEWLQQLTQVVDFLNQELGIMHQDVAPRNLLIDPCTVWNNISMHRTDLLGRTYQQHLITVCRSTWAQPRMESHIGLRVIEIDTLQ
jgi:thiamine kinase-like enzyme